MSAYLVDNDTLDLLASFIARWSQDSHMAGMDLYLEDSTLPPRTEEIEIEVDRFGRRRVLITNTMAQAVKNELLAENIASLWGRYPAGRGEGLDDAQGLISERDRFRGIPSDEADLSDVAGSLHCYEYQACETDDWKLSFAYALCQGARRKIISHLMNQKEDNWGYTRKSRALSR